jgi:hypothetical protein
VSHLELLHGRVRLAVLGSELHELAKVLFECLSRSNGQCKFESLHKLYLILSASFSLTQR